VPKIVKIGNGFVELLRRYKGDISFRIVSALRIMSAHCLTQHYVRKNVVICEYRIVV